MSTITTGKAPETTTLIDSVNSNLTYVGEAKLGSSDSDAVWQITRIEKSGTISKVQYANGSKRFNQKWDDRSILTYSN